MDLIKNEAGFNAPKPTTQGLVDHQNNLEFSDDKSGLQTLLSNDEGYIIGRIGDEPLLYKTDTHLLTIAPTGGGKGTGLIIPNLLSHSGSVLVIDIRGETVKKTATARRLQGHQVIVLDPYELTHGQFGIDSYNPFDRISQDTESRLSDDRILRLTQALMFDPSGRMSNEPIWDNATKNLLSGLITLCVRYWENHRHNLVEILDVLNYTQSEMEDFVAELKTLIETDPKARKDRQLKGLLKTLTESKATTKITDNALTQAQTLLTWVGNRSFEGIIEDSTFSFDSLQNGKTTVYLVVPEEFIENCAVWVRLMLESAVFSLEDVSSSKGVSTSQLSQGERVLFLLDELPAFGQLDIISSGMATLRGRGLNLWLFIQNLAQLESTYGKEKMRTIIGNASALQVFASKELEELEYFSRLIGEEFYDVQSVSITETVTEGTSTTTGTSHTVSNSESISHTTGTSDSTTESKN
ncbi:MAG: type IV secretory system conjugative DNA transfer family protein, partial [Bacteroidetes bacterium]|nr:type IV secretory system conjugative DNA transfer family protein [Bacteroidota bacterium]